MNKTIRAASNRFIAVVRDLDLRDITPPDSVIFTPYPGKRVIVTNVLLRTRKRTGTATTPPQLKVTNGTTDIVAANAGFSTTAGASAQQTVLYGDNVVDNTHPLTITQTVASAGGTVHRGDLVITGILL